MPDYTQAARDAVELLVKPHFGLAVLSAGESYGGNAEGILASRTVTTSHRSQAVVIFVYEAIFFHDGTGFLMEIATTNGDASFDQASFKWDLIDGEVKIKEDSGDAPQ